MQSMQTVDQDRRDAGRRVYELGARSFVLDRVKAEAALAAKRVVCGRETMTFNLLPLKYGWAYELYRTMKANHWEPEDIQMARDIEQWRDPRALSQIDRWIVRMGIGYFSAAEGIVGDNIIHVVRELVTASELKLVLGRHAHEENIHADSLLYMIASLQIDPHECEAMFEDIPTIAAKNRFVTEVSRELRRELDMTDPRARQLLARNVFVFGQCMEGTQRRGALVFGDPSHMYRRAWHAGLKTTYYLRTLGASSIEKATVTARATTAESAVLAVALSAGEAPVDPVSCSVGAIRRGGECDACQ